MSAVQTSVAGEIRWRLGLFNKAFERCRAGGFSFARFLALVPDRLRLAEGDVAARIRLPVAMAPELRARLAKLRLPERPASHVDLPKEREALRRWLRLAQVHPAIHPLSLQAWLTDEGDEILATLTGVQVQALAEVGRGEGGEETAYLAHLALLSALAAGLQGAEPGLAALVAELLPLGWARASELGVDPRPLSLRLAYQTALTGGLVALGAPSDDWVQLPCNPRRTLPEVLHIVHKLVHEPIETLPLERVVSAVARRLLAEPRLQQALLKDQLAESVRDAVLLLAARLHDPREPERSAPAIAVAASPVELLRTLFHHGRRAAFLKWLQEPAVQPERAAQALVRMLAGAEAVAQGDAGPLGPHADLGARAELAARGALLAALEAHTQSLLTDVTGLMSWVPAAHSEQRYREGRAYRLCADGAPMHLLAHDDRQGALHVDLGQLFGDQPPRAGRAAAMMQREIFEPLQAVLDAQPALTRASVSMTHLAILGPIDELMETAQAVLRVLEGWFERSVAEAAQVLGGPDEAEQARAEELSRLSRRVAQVDVALQRGDNDHGSRSMLLDSKAMLLRQIDLLTGVVSRRALGGREGAPSATLALSYGEAAQRVGELWVSRPLSEAARRVGREPDWDASLPAVRGWVSAAAVAAFQTSRAGFESETKVAPGHDGLVLRAVRGSEGRTRAVFLGDGRRDEPSLWWLMSSDPEAQP